MSAPLRELYARAVLQSGKGTVLAELQKLGVTHGSHLDNPGDKEPALRALLSGLAGDEPAARAEALLPAPAPDPAAAPTARGTVTVVTSAHGPVSKRYDLGPGRTLVKTSAPPLYAGTFETLELTVRELADLLPRLTPEQFLLHGVARDGSRSGTIATRDTVEKGTAPAGALARTKDNFVYAPTPGFAELDLDGLDGTKTGSQLRDTLVAAVPELANAAIVGVESASSMIYGTPRPMNELLRGRTGYRFYVLAANGADAPPLVELIHRRMLLAGHGRAHVRENGVIEPALRSSIDTTVNSPERPDFAGGAALGPGLVQERKVLVWNENASPIALADLPPLTAEERSRIEEMTLRLRAEAEPRAKQIREAWERARQEKGLKTGVNYASSGQVESLNADHDILLKDGTWVTGREIYANRKTYHGALCHDPLEPDYDGGRVVGKIYSEQDTVVIHSLAHGGTEHVVQRPPEEDFVAVGEPPADKAVEAETKAVEAETPETVVKANAEFALVVDRPSRVMWFRPGRETKTLPVEHWRLTVQNRAAIKKGDRLVPYSTWWLSHPERLLLESVIVDPRLPARTILETSDGLVYNQWPGLATQPSAEGSCDLVLDYIRNVVCAGDDLAFQWVIQYLAAMVQHPARLPGTALVLRGIPGAGKTTLTKIMERLVGKVLTKIEEKPDRITGRFNASLENKVLLGVEEAYFAGDPSSWGALKHLITADTLIVEEKNEKPYPVRNMTHVIMTSNSDFVVPASSDNERRFTVLDVSPARKNDLSFFEALHRQLSAGGAERFLYYLLHDVTVDWSFIGRPLRTRALMEQQLASLDPLRQWWLEVLRTGTLPGGSTPWANDLHDVIQRFVERTNRHEAARMNATRIGLFLKSVGAEKDRARDKGARAYRYTFPPLAAARAAFASKLAAEPEWDDVQDWQEPLEVLTP